MAMFIQKPWYNRIGNVKIVSFANGTDEEIAAMLNAYYANRITWADMGWAVGDTRKIHLNAYTAPSPNSSITIPAQDVTIVIVDHDHTPLASPIGEHSNACITVQFKEALGSTAYNGQDGSIYVSGDADKDFSPITWGTSYMRAFMNSTLLDAFSYTADRGSDTSFKKLIKPSSHYRHTNHNGTTSEEVIDTLFLPSYPEIYGTAAYNYYVATNPVEGTQFSYYMTAANRFKYANNNGIPGSSTLYWWIGSISSQYSASQGYYWCDVLHNKSAACSNGIGTFAGGLAPAFVL